MWKMLENKRTQHLKFKTRDWYFHVRIDDDGESYVSIETYVPSVIFNAIEDII